MDIVVLEYSTTTAYIYTKVVYNNEVSATYPLVVDLEQEGIYEDWASMDDNDIIEMWLAEVKGHKMSDCHYMVCDELRVDVEEFTNPLTKKAI